MATLTSHDINEELENMSENIKINNFETEELPRLFVPHHCVKLDAKFCIMKALRLDTIIYSNQLLSKETSLLAQILNNCFWMETLKAMEETIRNFKVVSLDSKILGVAPWSKNLGKTTKLLVQLRKDSNTPPECLETTFT